MGALPPAQDRSSAARTARSSFRVRPTSSAGALPSRCCSLASGAWWDSLRIGIGPPPLRTEHGWLLIYHGVKGTVSGDIYRVGLALLDLDEPTRVLRRLPAWILAPVAPYERTGDVPNVVFPCGLVHEPADRRAPRSTTEPPIPRSASPPRSSKSCSRRYSRHRSNRDPLSPVGRDRRETSRNRNLTIFEATSWAISPSAIDRSEGFRRSPDGYRRCLHKGEIMGYGLVGILVVILLIVAIVYFLRRA